LVSLTGDSQAIALGEDLAYYNDYGWSPDGSRLAYVVPVFDDRWEMPVSSEIFVIAPSSGERSQQTRLIDSYGTARINGLRSGDLSWSPDGKHIVFWVTDLTGLDPVEDAGRAVLHVLDVDTRMVKRYCHFSTSVNTPNPPHLVWSPDSSHVAFGADLPDDERAAMLLALNIESGSFTILSEGVYPTFGAPDVAAWGLPPL
jgi:Tol biopolymer transport system component